MADNVMIVNECGKVVGTAEKILAHKKGLLHRAFSVILINKDNEILIQKRAKSKYHSGGLWANSFCSHYYEGENDQEAIRRAGMNELGIEIDEFEYIGMFKYKAQLGSMCEHEIDRVFVVRNFDKVVRPNQSEVSSIRWIKVDECITKMNEFPDDFTSWFKLILSNEYFIEQIKLR